MSVCLDVRMYSNICRNIARASLKQIPFSSVKTRINGWNVLVRGFNNKIIRVNSCTQTKQRKPATKQYTICELITTTQQAI